MAGSHSPSISEIPLILGRGFEAPGWCRGLESELGAQRRVFWGRLTRIGHRTLKDVRRKPGSLDWAGLWGVPRKKKRVGGNSSQRSARWENISAGKERGKALREANAEKILKGCIWSLKFQLFLSSSPRKAPSNLLGAPGHPPRVGLLPASISCPGRRRICFQTMCIEGEQSRRQIRGAFVQLLKAWVCVEGAVRALRQCEPRLHVMGNPGVPGK